jgi:RNAse (barnase) inhibitor barstar
MDEKWPFDQPPNCAVITTTHVIREGCEVTYVYHDEDDHGWQFHHCSQPSMKDAMIVSLQNVLAKDSSLLEVADLPPGWMATRPSRSSPWERKLQHADTPVVEIDWPSIQSQDAFFDLVADLCGFPSWHGRNLDALADSWVTGGIDSKGPPYVFNFAGGSTVSPELTEFRDAVQQIARESVDENGGRFRLLESEIGESSATGADGK